MRSEPRFCPRQPAPRSHPSRLAVAPAPVPVPAPPGSPAPQLGGSSSRILPSTGLALVGRYAPRAPQPSPRCPRSLGRPSRPGRSHGAGRPCRQLAELRSVRVASAVWRRKCGLIIDPRLLSSNATSDLASLKRKCRRADFCGRLSPPTPPGSPFQVELLQYAIRSKCLLFCALFTALGRRVINLAQP